ncbi:unnamed protein product [Auanema sp. JU1783]|nr:unnamed protein product [Auanema sp. JU1783]
MVLMSQKTLAIFLIFVLALGNASMRIRERKAMRNSLVRFGKRAGQQNEMMLENIGIICNGKSPCQPNTKDQYEPINLPFAMDLQPKNVLPYRNNLF